jgi:hypothetical protein
MDLQPVLVRAFAPPPVEPAWLLELLKALDRIDVPSRAQRPRSEMARAA